MSPSNSSQSSENRRRFLAVLTVGISVAVLVSLMLFVLMRGAVSGVPLLFFVAMLAATLVLAPVVAFSQRKPSEKRKRNLDAYALIDRMVEELDDDELDYLRRRLEARDATLPDEDVAASMEELLERRSGKR